MALNASARLPISSPDADLRALREIALRDLLRGRHEREDRPHDELRREPGQDAGQRQDQRGDAEVPGPQRRERGLAPAISFISRRK